MSDADRIDALERRMVALEKAVSALDSRTIGSVRLGPRQKTEEEITKEAEAFGRQFNELLKAKQEKEDALPQRS